MNHPKAVNPFFPYQRLIRLLALATTATLCAIYPTSLSLVRAESTPPLNSEIIKLPELSITDKTKLRPEEKWINIQIDGFSIYSDASEFTVREFIKRLHRFHSAFACLFPKAVSPTQDKVFMILCASGDKFEYLSPPLAESPYRTAGSHTLVSPDATYQVINLDWESVSTEAADQNIENNDAANYTEEQLANIFHNDNFLRREYINLILQRHHITPPAWLAEGFNRYFASIKVGIKRIEFGQLDRGTINFFRKRALLPMADFFATTYDSADYKQPYGTVFSEQALAFTHFGMFAYKMKYQRAFLEFIEQASHEPVTETMFKQYFKMSYRQMEEDLRDYTSGGFYRHAVAPKGPDFPKLPSLEFHQVPAAEYARIQGDILRLLKRPDAARLELITPVFRKQADARLLAALGILDYENNNRKAAHKFLEQSVTSKVDNPAAYIALARLRLADATESNPEPRLNADQTAAVLSPLFAALDQKLSSVDLYLTIADTWLYAKATPSLDNLAVIDIGVLAFPRNADLIYKDATLKARNGYTEDARSLIELGLKVSRASENQNRFSQLRDLLPPQVLK